MNNEDNSFTFVVYDSIIFNKNDHFTANRIKCLVKKKRIIV